MFLFQLFNGLFSKFILTESAHSDRVKTKLSCVEREICRSTTKFLSFGKHIPECFTETYYVIHKYKIKDLQPSDSPTPAPKAAFPSTLERKPHPRAAKAAHPSP